MRAVQVTVLWISTLIGNAFVASADLLIFKNGSRSEVQSVEITDRAVHVVTLTGQHLALIRDAIDIAATLAANRPRRSSPPPRASEAGPKAAPPPGPPNKPARKPVARQVPRHEPESPQSAPRPVTPPRPPRPRPRPPAPRPTAPRAPAMEVGPSPHRVALFVNGSLATSPLGFTESRSFELFREPAHIDNVYEAPRRNGLELGAFLRLRGLFGIGGSVELFRNDNEGAYEAFLPHPFYFERYRRFSGLRKGLSYTERAIHVDGVVSKTWRDRLTLDVFGGPSFFLTKTELLLGVLYSEVYPYDAVVPSGVETAVFEDRPLGYNVGATATYRVAGRVGVDFGFRYSTARIRLEPGEQRRIVFDAGGLRAGAGLRFFFR